MSAARYALILAALGLFATAAPAAAVVEETRPWIPKRHPGAPLEEEPPPPISGWRFNPTLTFPYTLGLGASYLFPGTPATWRVGGSWGLWGDEGLIGFKFQDFRLYGSLVYFLVPGADGGPYVETGLDLMRSSRPVLGVGWPVIPHLGFGTIGRLGETYGWDVNFTAAGNGLLTLEGGLWF